MPFDREVGLGPGDIVLDGDPAPPSSCHLRKKGTAAQFLAHVYCGQTAVCIRIPPDTEVGLSLGDIVLDGDPAPPPLKGHSHQFLANVPCGQMAGWTKMPLGMEIGLGPGNFVFDADPASPRAPTPPNFWPMSIEAKWLDGSRCHLIRR